jgi:hypothetical protein
MVVYELDPTPWPPLGHEIIDGGPTRLPRTLCTPAVVPPRCHGNYCIAYAKPAQLEGNGFWCNQVNIFIHHNLELEVMHVQPWLFGIGIFKMRRSTARQILIRQLPYRIEDDVSSFHCC